jgi:hypothetical protein
MKDMGHWDKRRRNRGTKDENRGIEPQKREHWDSLCGLGDEERRMGDRDRSHVTWYRGWETRNRDMRQVKEDKRQGSET